MKILICEDEPVMLLVLTAMLKKMEYQVITSKDGREAIQLIDSESPDIVITDMLLPIVSGAEIISYIKNLPGKDIPVILLSAMPAHLQNKNEDGYSADAYLTKPVLPAQLKSKIEEVMGLKRTMSMSCL